MSLLDDYRRLRRAEPCIVCDHLGWCLVARDNPPSSAICSRLESPRRFGEAGWFHKLRDDGRPSPSVRRVRIDPAPAHPDLGALAAQYSMNTLPEAIAKLGWDLGVSMGSLRRLRIGWNGRAWTFPMMDFAGRTVGIRFRFPDGHKLSARGGHEGLFVPSGMGAGSMVLICEGPTDTGAMLDLGLDAVGRPSCTGGTRLIVGLVKTWHCPGVAVIADADQPGQNGAASLASVLAVYCPEVRVVTPPHPHKDARAWVNAGATRQDIQSAINAAPARRITVRSRRTP